MERACPLGSRLATAPPTCSHVYACALQLLEERDAELERLEKELASHREAGAAHNSGLAEARRLAVEREAALREEARCVHLMAGGWI